MLFHLGIAQLQLGLFDDALATFESADAYDTPQVSRWTWLLGEDLTLVVLQRYEEALDWLQRSLAVTPGTGRTHMVLAAAYEALGRHEEEQAAIAAGMKLRPGATVDNVNLPPKNESARYLAARARIDKLLIAAGLPAH
jgi:tetratricopeptide (TPR) repeat protein